MASTGIVVAISGPPLHNRLRSFTRSLLFWTWIPPSPPRRPSFPNRLARLGRSSPWRLVRPFCLRRVEDDLWVEGNLFLPLFNDAVFLALSIFLAPSVFDLDLSARLLFSLGCGRSLWDGECLASRRGLLCGRCLASGWRSDVVYRDLYGQRRLLIGVQRLRRGHLAESIDLGHNLRCYICETAENTARPKI
jgi:hypothetical protein